MANEVITKDDALFKVFQTRNCRIVHTRLFYFQKNIELRNKARFKVVEHYIRNVIFSFNKLPNSV